VVTRRRRDAARCAPYGRPVVSVSFRCSIHGLLPPAFGHKKGPPSQGRWAYRGSTLVRLCCSCPGSTQPWGSAQGSRNNRSLDLPLTPDCGAAYHLHSFDLWEGLGVRVRGPARRWSSRRMRSGSSSLAPFSGDCRPTLLVLVSAFVFDCAVSIRLRILRDSTDR
jgi:hypothetical protein